MLVGAVMIAGYTGYGALQLGAIQYQVQNDTRRLDKIQADATALEIQTTTMRIELANSTAQHQLQLSQTDTLTRERIAKAEQQIINLETQIRELRK